MDGWDEAFNHDNWTRAFEITGIDPTFYAHRERPESEILPWNHIAGGGRREYLRNQYEDYVQKLHNRSN